MSSNTSMEALAAFPGGVLSLLAAPPAISLAHGPLLARPVPAGFPSPADDYIEGPIDLNRHLIAHQEATFFIRVAGDSMTGFGIHDGDLLVVDRAIEASDQSIVIAVLEGDFTVKQLRHDSEGCLLRAGNTDYPDIRVGAEQALTIWGVVRWSIHEVGSCRQASR